jgi:photosystem II stability/assembly factor-like uncharacterized protein
MNNKSVLWIILKNFSFLTYLIVFILLSIYNIVLQAQWIQTNGPFGGTVHCLTTSKTNIYAGTDYGIYRSTDLGINWIPTNNGLTNTNIVSLAVSDTNIFAGTKNGVFLSKDEGTNWIKVGLNQTVNTFILVVIIFLQVLQIADYFFQQIMELIGNG